MALIDFLYEIGSSRAQELPGRAVCGATNWGSAPLMVGQALPARILTNHCQYRDAEQLVPSATALAAQTDLLGDHADTPLEFSHVLAAEGQVSEARSAATQSLGLYQRKGNLPGARESLRYLTQSAPA